MQLVGEVVSKKDADLKAFLKEPVKLCTWKLQVRQKSVKEESLSTMKKNIRKAKEEESEEESNFVSVEEGITFLKNLMNVPPKGSTIWRLQS